MRKIFIPRDIRYHLNVLDQEDTYSRIREDIQRISAKDPDVSVVIPAYNEAKSILHALSSIAATKTGRSVELIVVNNNSTDQTEEIVKRAGARCVREERQGYMHARNAGLNAARGTIVLNADADSVYPADWIDKMSKPLDDDQVSVVYGRYAFIPTSGRKRWYYYFYETAGDFFRLISKYFKEEAAFVMGVNSAFRREQALKVDGYSHPPGANEDGYLALKLKTFGQLYYNSKSMVWTDDRSLVSEGGFVKLGKARLRKFFRRIRLAFLRPDNGILGDFGQSS